MKCLPLCIALLTAALCRGEEVRIDHYEITLPPGHVHVSKKGIDSSVGEIHSREQGLHAWYDVGASAGLKTADPSMDLERTETLTVPAGTGRLLIGKADKKGERRVRFALPPDFNIHAQGPGASVTETFKRLLSGISFRDPVPADALDFITARTVEGGKQVKITVTLTEDKPIDRGTAPGTYRLRRFSLYESGILKDLFARAGDTWEATIDADKAADTALLVEGGLAFERGVRTARAMVPVPELLKRAGAAPQSRSTK